MADTLNIFGTEYANVAGIIATTPSEIDLTYIRPQGTKSITENGTGIDVAAYASIDVSVSGGIDGDNLAYGASLVGSAVVGSAIVS